MTGDSMKSNIAVESRYRSEGRPGYLRRRASRPMHIDPEDTDLTLAIQESLRYAKLHEQKLAKENANSETNETKHDDSNASKTINDVPTDGAQEKNLKELMVLHIDYVHQLNKTISEKDDEIRDLKATCDALQCRLERMERRMAMLKQKGEAHTVVHDTNLAPLHGPPGEKSLKRVRRQLKPGKNHFKKCKSTQKSVTRLRERGSQKQSYKEETSEEDSSDKDDDDDDDDKDDQSSSDESGESSRDGVETSDMESQTESETEMEVINSEDIVTTKKPYYVDIPACYQHSELREKPAPPAGEKPPAPAEGVNPVEVPGWRRHVVTNLYQMEGTENIEDEEYRRRHAKPEAEERRRKRWDLQQMREQELLERQRKRQEAELPVHMQPKPYINSFYPNPEDITHIEVTKDIPVMMFGRPLPKITQQDFELPWKVPARHSARLGGQRRK